MTSVDAALRDLLAGLDEDHSRLSRTLLGEPAPPPDDAELAALAAELLRLRWWEPQASAVALLGDAASGHAAAVERHVAWLAGSRASTVVQLAPVVVEPPVFSLAS